MHNQQLSKQNIFMYFNYHGKIKELLKTDTVTKIEIVDNHNGIKPAMLLHFKNHKPMPIREHKWDEYIKLLLDE